MLFEKKGSVHTIVFALVILVGFGIALGWPQYKKHQTITHAQEALELGKALAFAESSYKSVRGKYTPNFAELNLALPCPMEMNNGKPEMVCSEYVFHLEEGHLLRIQHKGLPKWFDLDIENGTVDCSHEDGSIAGSHICNRVNLAAPIK